MVESREYWIWSQEVVGSNLNLEAMKAKCPLSYKPAHVKDPTAAKK